MCVCEREREREGVCERAHGSFSRGTNTRVFLPNTLSRAVQHLGCRVWGLQSRVKSVECRVLGVGCRVQGVGCGV